MNKRNFIRSFVILACLIVYLGQAFAYFILKKDVFLSSIISLIFTVVLIIVFYAIDAMQNEATSEVGKDIDAATKHALNFGGLGMLSYNDEYEITYMSDFFSEEEKEFIGDKLFDWIPETQDILEGEVNRLVVVNNDDTYEINKVSGKSILIFKDITDSYNLNKQLHDSAYVLGLVNYDNYDEYQESEEILTFVNTNIKTPVLDYFRKYNCTLKTLKNHKLMLILNEEIFKKILDDRFSILTTVRKVSNENNLDVTLSMSFARGSDNLVELDETAQSLLELAQTRGGDQVVVRKIGEDVSFFGGTTEAREKLNMTKVRVMINSIKDLISKASNVIIVGHKDADADCIGSGLCVSNISLDMGKPTYFVCGQIEPMIKDVLNKYADVINKKHQIISENQALELYDKNSLIIMVDHHSMDQTCADTLLKKAKKIIIIDHHRRKQDLEVSPLMYYIEASASSTCELACEFLPYMSRKLILEPEEANIMYIGLLIDTDGFRVRTGSRTFDVAKQLRRFGANPLECDEMIQEPYDNVMDRSYIISQSRQYKKNVIISSVEDKEFSRSIASQACDEMIKSKQVECAFVICNISKDETIITARSKGNINVQTILEKMNGGGHMSAAGLQRKDTSVKEVETELLTVLDEYFIGVNDNESNTNS